MNTEKKQLLITGPNMAGKSTVMRQTALSVIMAQMGGFVAADHIDMPFTPLKVWQAIQSAKNHALP